MDRHHLPSTIPLTPVLKMRTYRQRMRDAGLRPVQIWVPDTRSTSLRTEAQRQSVLASQHQAAEKDVLDFIDDVADW